jgi:hypothetical protein
VNQNKLAMQEPVGLRPAATNGRSIFKTRSEWAELDSFSFLDKEKPSWVIKEVKIRARKSNRKRRFLAQKKNGKRKKKRRILGKRLRRVQGE